MDCSFHLIICVCARYKSLRSRRNGFLNCRAINTRSWLTACFANIDFNKYSSSRRENIQPTKTEYGRSRRADIYMYNIITHCTQTCVVGEASVVEGTVSLQSRLAGVSRDLPREGLACWPCWCSSPGSSRSPQSVEKWQGGCTHPTFASCRGNTSCEFTSAAVFAGLDLLRQVSNELWSI